MHISISSKRCKYELDIHGKYSVIGGDSGSGKSTLYKMIMLWEAENKAIKASCDYKLHAVAINENSSFLENNEGCIIVIDEYCKILREPNISSILRKSKNYFILITRKILDFLPVSVDNYYEMKTTGIVHTNIPIYSRFTNRNYRGIKTIVTEDKRSGYLYFKDYYDCDVKSAHSKSEVVNYLIKNKLIDPSVLVVYDAAAFAYQAKSFYDFCNKYKVQVLDWESFEHEILLNYPFNEKLTQDDCSYLYESLEQLSTCVLSNKIRYNKSSLTNCLKKEFTCDRCNRDCEFKHSRTKPKTFSINENINNISAF